MACDCCECNLLNLRPHIGLDEWADCLCWTNGSQDRFHFWQLAQDPNSPFNLAGTQIPGTPIITYDPTSPCERIVFQGVGFSNDGTSGRNQIYDKILQAGIVFNEMFYRKAGYYPFVQNDCYEYTPIKAGGGFGPAYSAISSHASYLAGQTHLAIAPEAARMVIQLPHKKITELGREKIDFFANIALDPTQFVDSNGDGLLDQVTLTFPNTGSVFRTSKPDQVMAFFVDADRLEPDLYRNEIREIQYTITSSTVTVVIPLRLLVKPTSYAGAGHRPLDPNNRAIYASAIQIRRRWLQSDGAVTVMRRKGCHCGCKCSCGSVPFPDDDGCFECTTRFRTCILNAEEGIVEVTSEDIKSSGDSVCCDLGCHLCTDRICIRYNSGDCLPVNCIIARLAAALLSRNVCCSNFNPCFEDAVSDHVGFNRETGKLVSALTNPEKAMATHFGTRSGGLEAIRFIMNMAHEKMFVGMI